MFACHPIDMHILEASKRGCSSFFPLLRIYVAMNGNDNVAITGIMNHLLQSGIIEPRNINTYTRTKDILSLYDVHSMNFSLHHEN